MVIFEIKRMLGKKHLFYAVITIFLIFSINFVMEISTGEFNENSILTARNSSQAICQFSLIAFLPFLSDVYAKDYSKKNVLFYLQNNISLKKLFLLRTILYDFMISIIYIVFLFFMYSYRIKTINKTILIISFIDILVVLSSVNVIICFSLILKKKSKCIGGIIILWLCSQIINMLSIPSISGFFLPVDSSNNISLYIASSLGDVNMYKNLIKGIPLELQIIFCCLFWIIIPLIIGNISLSKCFKNRLLFNNN